MKNTYKIVDGKSEGKQIYLKDQIICVDNFKMDIKTLVWGGVHWISQWSAL
jgi:hypothetical protein